MGNRVKQVKLTMQIRYPEIGICGLACPLCPRFHTRGSSRCEGCKSPARMAAGCPFITCAVKKKGIEFCWECDERRTCERWREHSEFGRRHDTFVCYGQLEANIAFLEEHGAREFQKAQRKRVRLLNQMLEQFDEGRSKTFYCIAATLLEVADLETALEHAGRESSGGDIKAKAQSLHSQLNEIAARQGLELALRK